MPTVAVVNQKGGVGKTTVVLGLASAAAHHNIEALVVDVDPQGNALVPTLQGGTVTVVSGTTFIRGDGNRDGLVNIGDGIFALAYLFSGQPATCEDALDGNDDGQVNVADAVFLLSWLFNSGTEPPAPFPDAGLDPTADPLDCVL